MVPPAWLEQLPSRRDILLCYFPYVEDHGKPSLDVHPVVVLAVGKGVNGIGLLVAYGSSRGLHKAGPTNIIVDPTEFKGTGLKYPTRFDVERHRWLPYNAQYFHKTNNGTPRLGVLPPELHGHLDEARHQVELRIERSLITGQPSVAERRETEHVEQSPTDADSDKPPEC